MKAFWRFWRDWGRVVLLGVVWAGVIAGLASVASGAELKLTGPDKPVAVGDDVDITVDGLAETDWPNTDLTCWPAAKCRAIVEPFGAKKLTIEFRAKTAAEYLVKIHVSRGGKLEKSQVVIKAGGTPPGPDPKPDPTPPPPPPGGKKQVVIFCQSVDLDNLPAGQRILAASLKFRLSVESMGHRYLGQWDPNLKGKDAKTVPADKAPWFQAVDGKQGPQLAVAPVDGGTIQVFPLPADEAAFWKLLEGKP